MLASDRRNRFRFINHGGNSRVLTYGIYLNLITSGCFTVYQNISKARVRAAVIPNWTFCATILVRGRRRWYALELIGFLPVDLGWDGMPSRYLFLSRHGSFSNGRLDTKNQTSYLSYCNSKILQNIACVQK